MGNGFNIPVPPFLRYQRRGDAEVKGQPPDGWWFKQVGGAGRQIRRSVTSEMRIGGLSP
jgi:hypothetical protein